MSLSETANELYDSSRRLPDVAKLPQCRCRRRCSCWAAAYSWNMKTTGVLVDRMYDLHPQDTVTPQLLAEWYETVGTSFFADNFRSLMKPFMIV